MCVLCIVKFLVLFLPDEISAVREWEREGMEITNSNGKGIGRRKVPVNLNILSGTVSELSQLIVQISHQRGHFVPDSFHTAVTAEALRAKICRKSAILHQRGHFDPKFLVQGVAPHQ